MSSEKKPQNEVANPLAIAKLLGPSNPKLDHLIRFLNSVRGTDKVLMVKCIYPNYTENKAKVDMYSRYLVYSIFFQNHHLVCTKAFTWIKDCWSGAWIGSAYQKLCWTC